MPSLFFSGIYLLKLYFSITKKEQERRFKDIVSTPIKKWKYSEVDKHVLCRFGMTIQPIKKRCLKKRKSTHLGRLLKLIEKQMPELQLLNTS